MAKTVAEQIVDALAVAYAEHTGDDSIPFSFGELERSKEAKARRIVFVRANGDVTPPERTGGMWMRDGFEGSNALFDKVEALVAHIYDPDEGNLESVHENFLVSAANLLGTGFQPGRYDWITETEDGARHTKRVHKLEQQFTLRLGVAEKALKLVVVEGIRHSCGFGAGGFSNGFSRGFQFAGVEPGH